MASLTFAEFKDLADTPSNVRKALQGVCFLAPLAAGLPLTLLDVDKKLIQLPVEDGWWPLGIVSKDGYELARDISKEEVEAFGYADNIREDIVKAVKSLKVTPLESDKRQQLELAYGLDLSAIAASATSGEIVFEEPDVPEAGDYRLLAIFMDGTITKPYYRGFAFGKAKLADIGSEKFNSSDPRSMEMTLDAGTGPEGFSVRHYIGGAAFDPVAHGFQAAPTP